MKPENIKHACQPEYANHESNYSGYGCAIEECIEQDFGEYWVGNNEYYSRVNYCPFCGMKAPKQIKTSK